MKEKRHYAPNYFVNPTHPITISVIGAGGNGSQVLQGLARMNVTLQALGHPGILVALFDGDRVTESNQGRQLFAKSDIGRFKSTVLVERINRFYGFNWWAETEYWTSKLEAYTNVVISCVDSVQARTDIANAWNKYNGRRRDYIIPYYWMDLGNSNNSGQIVLGSNEKIDQPKSRKYEVVPQLPTIDKEFDLTTMEDDDSPSCSLAEAIEKQDLFINPIVSNYACHLLWSLMRNHYINHRGYYVNLSTGKTNPIGL